MKRERLTQATLPIVGLFNLALIRFLFKDLWHSAWLLEGMNEAEPMFLSVFFSTGVALLLAVRQPAQYRSMIAFIGWWNIAPSSVMFIQTVQSWKLDHHRRYDDVILFFVIGVILLVALPPRSMPIVSMPA